jgi:hypothetical protein
MSSLRSILHMSAAEALQMNRTAFGQRLRAWLLQNNLFYDEPETGEFGVVVDRRVARLLAGPGASAEDVEEMEGSEMPLRAPNRGRANSWSAFVRAIYTQWFNSNCV